MNTITILVIALLLGYGIVVAILSKIGANKTKGDSAEYFVAGRSASPILLLGTLLLTIWSALSFYGWPAAAYRSGLGYMSGATGTFFMAFMGPCIMYPLWVLGKKYNYQTPISILTHKYNSSVLSSICAGICVVFTIPYIAIQVIAVADGIDVTTKGQIPYILSVIIVIVYVFAHLVGGGSNSVIRTDTTAGFLGVAIVIVFTLFTAKNVFLANDIKGLTGATQWLLETNPEALSHTGNYNSWFNNLGLFISAGAGLLFWPHVLVRSFMGRGPEVFKLQSIAQPLIVCFLFSVFIFQGVFIGGIGFHGLEGAATDSIIPMLGLNFAPPIVTALLVVGVFAFGMSTADSQAVVVQSVIEKEIYKSTDSQLNKNRLYKWLAALAVGVLLIVIFRPALLVTYAYSLSSPAFVQMGPAIIGALFWRKATKEGAIVGIIAGLVGVLFSLFIYNPVPSVNPVLWGLILNIPLFIIVSSVTKPYEKGTKEVTVYLSEFFKERNNGEFKLLLALTVLVLIQEVCTCYLPHKIVFGWVPLQMVNHWLVAIECAVLGYFFSRNRFGKIKNSQVKVAE